MAGTLSNRTFPNRKVARAARTGGNRRRTANRPYGFYGVIALILIVGVGTVTMSRDQRLSKTNYGSTPPLAPIPDPNNESVPLRAGSQWFEAIGFYECGNYVANINTTANPYGLSTNNDGVIHISPFQRKYAGHNSTLGLFAKAVGLKIDRTSFQVPGEPTAYKTGTQCDGKAGEFVLKQWTNASDNSTGKKVLSDPQELLLEDNHALTVAWVPTGTDVKTIPLPPSASTLAAVKAAANTAPAAAAPATTATTEPSAPTSAPGAAPAPTATTVPTATTAAPPTATTVK